MIFLSCCGNDGIAAHVEKSLEKLFKLSHNFTTIAWITSSKFSTIPWITLRVIHITTTSITTNFLKILFFYLIIY